VLLIAALESPRNGLPLAHLSGASQKTVPGLETGQHLGLSAQRQGRPLPRNFSQLVFVGVKQCSILAWI